MPTQSAAAEKISLYQPDQEDLIFPKTPVFDQVADDREYQKNIWSRPAGRSTTTVSIMGLLGT